MKAPEDPRSPESRGKQLLKMDGWINYSLPHTSSLKNLHDFVSAEWVLCTRNEAGGSFL